MSKGSPHKIAICFPFVGDFVGGSHLSALGLIRNLNRRRFEPVIVLHQIDGPLAELLRRERIPFERAPDLPRLRVSGPRNSAAAWRVLRAIPKLVFFLRRRGITVVHTNDGRMHVTWGFAGRLAGAKVLWHHRSDPSSFGLRWIAPLIADRVVAVSKFSSPRPGLFSAARKCKVVHSPFATDQLQSFDRFSSRARLVQELGCAPDAWILAYVGALIARKRPLLFVEVIAKLRELAPDLNVLGIFYGEASDSLDQKTLERAAELGIKDRIRLMGFRYPVEPWLAASDVLVVTAVNEPLGRTLVEAMLLGVPVVAASSGGSPEAVEDGKTGVLVRADDPRSFAEATLRLVRDPSRMRAIVCAAQEDARNRFGVDRHLQAITEIYEELAATGSP